MIICNSEKCFGCSLCFNICPSNAITMSDEKGFYRPIIDDNKCINCNLCKQNCISNSNISLLPINSNTPCFATYSNDDRVHYNAASGGTCFEISKKFIMDGGYVVGAWWNPTKQIVEHRICNNLSDLEYLKKSKYVYSDMNRIYRQIEEIHDKCLFIGVPCQVYAVKQFCKERENLYCIDLLCRGGASPKCLRDHIKQLHYGKVSNVTFRGGDDDCCFVIYNEAGKKVYRGPQFIDPYFNSFMEHIVFQRVCYECPFAGKERVGDLTIGDFWGLEKNTLSSNVQGINMVLCNTVKGEELLDSVKNSLSIYSRDAEEAIRGNDTLQFPTKTPDEYDVFWSNVINFGFKAAIDYKKHNEYDLRIIKSKNSFLKYRIKELLPNEIYSFLKKVKVKLHK